jgi:hypothetical protein
MHFADHLLHLPNTLQNNIGDLDTNNPFVKADLEGNLAKVSTHNNY